MSVTFHMSHPLKSARSKRHGTGLPLVLAAALPVLMLAGCGSTSTVSQTEKNFTERLFFANTKLPEQKTEAEVARDYGCPSTSILDGTAAYRVGDTSARGVSHQASITDLARECTTQGTTMRIKVGVQGRLILGDAGKPGTYTIPVRIAVRGNGQTIYSKLLPTVVTIPADDTQAAFVVIDDAITLPITAEDPGEAYSVLVGLDPQGGKQAPGKRKRQR